MMFSLTKTKIKLQALEDELYSCSADLVETCKGGAMQRHNDVRHSIRLKQGPAFRISAEPVQVYVFLHGRIFIFSLSVTVHNSDLKSYTFFLSIQIY